MKSLTCEGGLWLLIRMGIAVDCKDFEGIPVRVLSLVPQDLRQLPIPHPEG
jgi:hypothetical protein